MHLNIRPTYVYPRRSARSRRRSFFPPSLSFLLCFCCLDYSLSQLRCGIALSWSYPCSMHGSGGLQALRLYVGPMELSTHVSITGVYSPSSPTRLCATALLDVLDKARESVPYPSRFPLPYVYKLFYSAIESFRERLARTTTFIVYSQSTSCHVTHDPSANRYIGLGRWFSLNPL